MILVADSGSTKTEWCLIKSNGEKAYFDTEGYNPYYVGREYIIQSLNKNLTSHFKSDQIKEVHFYGAGCMADKTVIIEQALHAVFQLANVHAAMDLLAAARALLGRKPGFAAILGTGTNTCIYDGERIIQNIDSLGYMLGDEGSGSYLGKKLLQDYLRGYMPKEVSEKFKETVRLSFDEIMDRVYTQSLANRFCAGFAQFAGDHIEMDYLYESVKNSFMDFFTNLVSHYPDYQQYPFNCLGSVGYHFKSILKEVAGMFDMKTGKIIPSPMEGLVKYHA